MSSIAQLSTDRLNSRRSDKRSPLKSILGEKGTVDFSSLLSAVTKTAEKPSREDEYDQLESELDEHESLLAQTPTPENFFLYKKTVRKMLDHILNHGIKLRAFEDRKKRHYEYVQVIDMKLRSLLETLTRRRTDTVIALHLMGEIRGILVNTLR